MKAKMGYRNPSKKTREQIEHQAQAIFDRHVHFRGRAAQFEFDCQGDALIVRGPVPTFYLRETLQNALREVEGIRRLDNQVNVISPAGLSGTTSPTACAADVKVPAAARNPRFSASTTSATNESVPYRTLAC